jgi:hypothetical protein
VLTRGTLIYIGQRLVLIVFTVLAVSSVVFLGIHRLPGDALFNEHLHASSTRTCCIITASTSLSTSST